MSKKDDKKMLQDIKDSINNTFKTDGHDVANIMGEVEDKLQPRDWISTGDDILDLSISNRPNGGIPLGRFINIYGDSGLGKSLLVAKIFANAQKKGGMCVYFDTENASYPPYMKVLGVDPDRLIHITKFNTVEKIFKSMINFIVQFKEKGFTKPLIIAVDSMTAVTTETGADLDNFEKKGYGTGAEKQLLLGNALKKTTSLLKGSNIAFITTDQIRDNFDGGAWSPQHRSTTGHAQKFWSDVRIELRNRGKIKNNNGEVIGHKVQAKTVKNRLAPPYRETYHYLYNTHGIDNYASWIENANEYDIINIKGGGYVDVFDEDGNKIKNEKGNVPRKGDLKKMLRTDENFRKSLYEQFCDEMIIKYDPQDDAVFEDLEDIINVENDKNMENFKTETEGQIAKRKREEEED